MASFGQKLCLALAVSVSSVLANPVAVPEAQPESLGRPLPLAARGELMWEKRQGFGSCMNQSCEVALISGSTGSSYYPYSTYPTGDTKDGDCCIIRYFPAVKNEIYAYRPGLQAYCQANGGDAPADANPPGITSVSAAYPPPTQAATTTTNPLGLFARAAATAVPPCTPKILIFSKGTFETGTLGNTLGPQFQSNLDSSWSIIGVNYDNSLNNDYCLGLPGGINVRNTLTQVANACPNSKIAMAGYSQGALVTRHALARAPAASVARVMSVVTFGDPFVGAKIGQYNGPIHVYCNNGDGVCDGQLDITLAHLSYFGDVTPAIALLNSDLGS